MKKVVALLLTAVLCLSMSAIAFAVDSESEDNSTVEATNEVKVYGDITEELRQEWTDGQKAGWEKSTGNTSPAQAAAGDTESAVALIKEVLGKDCTVRESGSFEVTGSDNETGVPVEFAVASVKAGDEVVVLHLKADGSWENLTVTDVADGKFTAIMTTFSPVIYSILDASESSQPAETQPVETQPAETQPAETQPAETKPAETQATENQPAESHTEETQAAVSQPAEQSPRTGQSSQYALIGVALLAAFCAVYVIVAKREEQ